MPNLICRGYNVKEDQGKSRTLLEGFLSCVGVHVALQMVWSDKRFTTTVKCAVEWSLQIKTILLKQFFFSETGIKLFT